MTTQFKAPYKERISTAITAVAEVYFKMFDMLPNDVDVCELSCSEIEKNLEHTVNYCQQILDSMNSHEEFNDQNPDGVVK